MSNHNTYEDSSDEEIYDDEVLEAVVDDFDEDAEDIRTLYKRDTHTETAPKAAPNIVSLSANVTLHSKRYDYADLYHNYTQLGMDARSSKDVSFVPVASDKFTSF